MVNQENIEALIVTGLNTHLRSHGYNCPVIMANQTAPIPPYPYISYTVTTPVRADMKGYSIDSKGTRYKSLVQTWSFTANSDDDSQSNAVAMLAYDYFALSGNTYLSDNNIIAQRVQSITSRDNLLTIDYEYRKGFDVDFLLYHEISKADSETAGYIETVEFKVID